MLLVLAPLQSLQHTLLFQSWTSAQLCSAPSAQHRRLFHGYSADQCRRFRIWMKTNQNATNQLMLTYV